MVRVLAIAALPRQAIAALPTHLTFSFSKSLLKKWMKQSHAVEAFSKTTADGLAF
jgi:hypothetical protein